MPRARAAASAPCFPAACDRYNRIADDPEQVRALDAALVDLARTHGLDAPGGVAEWEYLLVTARVR